MRLIMPAPDPATESALERLHRSDLDAVLRGDKLSSTIARLLWGETYLAAYGVNEAALPNLSAVALQMLPPDADRSPMWKGPLERRPLVKVVSRYTYHVPYGYDRTALFYREVLECGHQLRVPASLWGDEPPQRRRCVQCRDRARGAA